VGQAILAQYTNILPERFLRIPAGNGEERAHRDASTQLPEEPLSEPIGVFLSLKHRFFVSSVGPEQSLSVEAYLVVFTAVFGGILPSRLCFDAEKSRRSDDDVITT